VISRVRLTLKGIRINLVRGWQETLDVRSFLQWVVDVFLYRLMSVAPLAGQRVRTIRLRPGAVLAYRRTRSDFRTVAETWLTEAYELPFELRHSRLILDLGTNIGATATWLATRYGCDRLIGVEPVPSNADLARRNLAANGLDAEVHEAAVAARVGTGYFDDSDGSTEGRLSNRGREVALVTVPALIGTEQVDLMKMDIEGAEGEVIGEGADWLDQVRAVVTELHPQYTDTDRVVSRLRQAGFEYRRLPDDPNTISGPEFMAVFWRPDAV
jgi:FkbM family methyltransferase